jgi:hypothetical protein
MNISNMLISLVFSSPEALPSSTSGRVTTVTAIFGTPELGSVAKVDLCMVSTEVSMTVEASSATLFYGALDFAVVQDEGNNTGKLTLTATLGLATLLIIRVRLMLSGLVKSNRRQ